MICNHDCFHCQYPDCIEDTITHGEYLTSTERDRENRYYSLDSSSKRKLRTSAKWRSNHREQERVRNHENYLRLKNDEARREKRRGYVRDYKARKKAERVS